MLVIKLGGSLLDSPYLKDWLSVIVAYRHGPIIVVPGGGVFADAVREAQLKTGLSDAIAHDLALQAMAQFGQLMAGLNPMLTLVATEDEIAECIKRQQAMIWLPMTMVRLDKTMAQHWEVTSDSLSVWLAQKLAATSLLLVKSSPLVFDLQVERLSAHQADVSLSRLSQWQLLDMAFADYLTQAVSQTNLVAWMMHHSQYAQFQQASAMPELARLGYLLTPQTKE